MKRQVRLRTEAILQHIAELKAELQRRGVDIGAEDDNSEFTRGYERGWQDCIAEYRPVLAAARELVLAWSEDHDSEVLALAGELA